MTMPRSVISAVLVAVLAVGAALWAVVPHEQQSLANYGSLLKSLLRLDAVAMQPTPTPSLASVYLGQEPLEPLDFDALRQYTAQNSRHALRWGTYRSGLYYGIRSRTYPYSVSAGLLWGSSHEDLSMLRHECRQEDRLQKYGWQQHDGRSYGLQGIQDQFNRVNLQTYYLRMEYDDDTADKRASGWASRFQVTHLEPPPARFQRKAVDTTKVSLFFYVDLGCGDETATHPCRQQLVDLLRVNNEPTRRACTASGDDEDRTQTVAFTCSSMTLQGLGTTTVSDVWDAPLAFDMQVQLRTRDGAAITMAELHYAGLEDTSVDNVKEKLIAKLTPPKPAKDVSEIVLPDTINSGSTLVVIQAIVEFSASSDAIADEDILLDVVFNERASVLKADPLTPVTSQEEHLHDRLASTIASRRDEFEARFQDVFNFPRVTTATQSAGFNSSEIAFAQAAFSNLIGGLGFFYGSSILQLDPEDPALVETKPQPLFTAVPSRSFFPRGFLWDEGFHQLGIGIFDREIARDVIAHWLGVMHDDGYIPREQILGQTARRRVPSEFLVQHVEHANPPTLLLALEKMIQQLHTSNPEDIQQTVTFVKLIFPFLERWYRWFVTTQQGPYFNETTASFRWRGRRGDDGKLIANTLSSGLDDYPRASTPSESEMHVDLLCWMIKASDILATLADVAQLKDLVDKYRVNRDQFITGLDTYHWDEEAQSFFDYGEHCEDGSIEQHIVVRCRNADGQIKDIPAPIERLRERLPVCPTSHSLFMFPLGDGAGGLKTQPVFIAQHTKLQHVRHIGYVSIFPLLLQVVAPDSPKLGAMLAHISDPAHLWSPYGLRSISTKDAFYEQENAPGDNPYWRGSIWINMNYLALRALHHYAREELQSPYQTAIAEIYQALRKNVISTIYREFQSTGYLWEQYNGNVHGGDQYGRGQRCHPFSGWTALVVNIMAEKY